MTKIKELEEQLKEVEQELENKVVQECEVYSRVVGYYRPIKQWNVGQQERWSNQEFFEVNPQNLN